HATVVGPRDGDLWSADYPGGLVAKLKELTGAEHVLFAAGAVGDVQPVAPAGKDMYERAKEMGETLAEALAGGLKEARYERRPAVSVVRLPVDLPGARIAAGAAWQWAPWGVRWVTDRVTHLHAVRVGESLWVGFPVDYTGSLARDLSERVRELGLTVTPTSFNGDYKGYFVRRDEYMNLDHYETRMLGFFGPWAGEYVNALAEGMARRMVGVTDEYPGLAPRLGGGEAGDESVRAGGER
ncbi:MAG: hypothetical protein IT442_17635, partial [Phycisphaeraceae bacterium]|nr:hypothetical protein [Phycisphaeraceae bacterium]